MPHPIPSGAYGGLPLEPGSGLGVRKLFPRGLPTWIYSQSSAKVCYAEENQDATDFLLNYCTGPSCLWAGRAHALLLHSVLLMLALDFSMSRCEMDADTGVQMSVSPLWIYAPSVLVCFVVAFLQVYCLKDCVLPYIMATGALPAKVVALRQPFFCNSTIWFSLSAVSDFCICIIQTASMHTNAVQVSTTLKTLCTCPSPRAFPDVLGWVALPIYSLCFLRHIACWWKTTHPPECAFKLYKSATLFQDSVNIGTERSCKIDYTIQIKRSERGKAMEVRWMTWATLAGAWKTTFVESLSTYSDTIGWTAMSRLLLEYNLSQIRKLGGQRWTEEGITWAEDAWPSKDEASQPKAPDELLTDEQEQVLKALQKEAASPVPSNLLYKGALEESARVWQHRYIRRWKLLLDVALMETIFTTCLKSTVQAAIQLILLAMTRYKDSFSRQCVVIGINLASIMLAELVRLRTVTWTARRNAEDVDGKIEEFRTLMSTPWDKERTKRGLCAVPGCAESCNAKAAEDDDPKWSLCSRHYQATECVKEFDKCFRLRRVICLILILCIALLAGSIRFAAPAIRDYFDACSIIALPDSNSTWGSHES